MGEIDEFQLAPGTQSLCLKNSGLFSVALEKWAGKPVSGEDMFAYLVAATATPSFTARFRDVRSTHGLRVPLTTDHIVLKEASDLGRLVIWPHSLGELMVDAKAGRPSGPPRLPVARRPRIEKVGSIPSDRSEMPDDISYDASTGRLKVGAGFVGKVDHAVWSYEVSGKQVLVTWLHSCGLTGLFRAD